MSPIRTSAFSSSESRTADRNMALFLLPKVGTLLRIENIHLLPNRRLHARKIIVNKVQLLYDERFCENQHCDICWNAERSPIIVGTDNGNSGLVLKSAALVEVGFIVSDAVESFPPEVTLHASLVYKEVYAD
jgi:hypothetical protein